VCSLASCQDQRLFEDLYFRHFGLSIASMNGG
jgi:hypothetical protein